MLIHGAQINIQVAVELGDQPCMRSFVDLAREIDP